MITEWQQWKKKQVKRGNVIHQDPQLTTIEKKAGLLIGLIGSPLYGQVHIVALSGIGSITSFHSVKFWVAFEMIEWPFSGRLSQCNFCLKKVENMLGWFLARCAASKEV